MNADLISRQEAIDALSNGALVNYQAAGHNNGLVKAIDIIKGLPSAHQWIPVSERLPEKKTEVIYSLDNHYVSTGYMTDRDYEGNLVELHWEDLESGAVIYPEAWLPLPEPYNQNRP